jgi:cytochrome c-type biogenesis protein
MYIYLSTLHRGHFHRSHATALFRKHKERVFFSSCLHKNSIVLLKVYLIYNKKMYHRTLARNELETNRFEGKTFARSRGSRTSALETAASQRTRLSSCAVLGKSSSNSIPNRIGNKKWTITSPQQTHEAMRGRGRRGRRGRSRESVYREIFAQFEPISSIQEGDIAHFMESFSKSVFDVTNGLDDFVKQRLGDSAPAAIESSSISSSSSGSLNPGTIMLVLTAGLVTSLSPCTLSVLPLTIGYIGGYASDAIGNEASEEEKKRAMSTNALAFAVGLAFAFALFGVFAATAGKAFGQIGIVAPISVSVLAIVMGLNLLGEVDLRFPSFGANFDARELNLPPFLTSFVAGATFALAASPCATPILSTLLAYVAASSSNVFSGAILLFSYTLGYCAPLLLAASAAGNIKSVMNVREKTAWVTPASGFLLVAGGWYALLGRVTPLLLR